MTQRRKEKISAALRLYIGKKEMSLFRKKRFWDFIRDLLIATAIGGLIILCLYVRMKLAQSEADKYKNAKFCQDKSDCRQIIESNIIDSKTRKESFSFWTGRNSSRTVTNFIYVVKINLESSKYVQVDVLPEAATNTNDFNNPKMFISLPITEQNNQFAENSFPVGTQAKVEMWNGKPVFLYSSHISHGAIVNEFTLDLFAPQNNPLPQNTYEEIAMPTTDNPLIYYETTKQDYYSSIIAVSFFVLVLLFIKFSLKSKQSFARRKL